MTFSRRWLGDTKVEVTAVAFRCASIGNLFVETSDAAADNVLVAAWDAGPLFRYSAALRSRVVRAAAWTFLTS